jgi:hypothetical protein
MRASYVTRARLPSWSDGRSPICPCTPYGRHWWLSCSRPCSATVDAPPWAHHRRIVATNRRYQTRIQGRPFAFAGPSLLDPLGDSRALFGLLSAVVINSSNDETHSRRTLPAVRRDARAPEHAATAHMAISRSPGLRLQGLRAAVLVARGSAETRRLHWHLATRRYEGAVILALAFAAATAARRIPRTRSRAAESRRVRELALPLMSE